ncbi:MAG: hypothetical protein ACYCST_15910 [Acidimicrobiales bacterium]
MGKSARGKRERRDARKTGATGEVIEHLVGVENVFTVSLGNSVWDYLDWGVGASASTHPAFLEICPVSTAALRAVIQMANRRLEGDGKPLLLDLDDPRSGWDLSMIRQVGLWRYGRGVYVVDPDLYGEICRSDNDGALQLAVLQRIPEWGLYLALPNPILSKGIANESHLEERWVSGAFVSIDVSDPMGPDACPQLHLSLDLLNPYRTGEWGGFYHYQLPIAGRTVADVFGDWRSSGEVQDWAVGNILDVIQPLLQVVFYICASNADFSDPAGRPITPRRGTLRSVSAGGERVVRVGYRIGPVLGAERRSGRGAGGGGSGGGSGVAPHLRRAHWHHYWVGPLDGAERRLDLRWLHPVLVGGKSEVPVVRPVRGGERAARDER